MADWKEWLKKGEDWAGKIGDQYTSSGQQASGTGAELSARKQMNDEAQRALGQSGPAPISVPTATPQMQSPSGMDSVNPGYQTIGGQAAVDQLYAGKPPELLPPPATKRSTFAHSSR